MRPQSSMDLAENFYKLKSVEKATFYSLVEIKAALSHISKSPEEREFLFDFGASMHMLSKKDLSSEELKFLRRSRTPTVVVTANVEVRSQKLFTLTIHWRFDKSIEE